MDSRQAYLAAKYMSGPKADAILAKSSKSKKKKTGSTTKPSTSSAFVLQDNDTPWSSAPDSRGDGDNEQSMYLADAVVASDRSFKKRRGDGGGGWETIRAPTPPPPDEQPVVVQDEGPRIIGGILGGAELTRLRGETEAAPVADQMDTVYRDASGRKIDTKAEKAAAARRKRLQEEKEAQKMEWGKGLVQRDEAERNRQELEREKTRDIARYADDAELNEVQKQQARWNDPAAVFLSNSKASGPQKPQYQGPPPPPNRFGIAPGYRWDGVDRSNGFERKLFQRSNERSRADLEGYHWRSEDM